MTVWITNAFDSSNLGDDFLLRAVLEGAHVPAELADQVCVVSNHPESLAGRDLSVRPAPGARRGRSLRAVALQGALNYARLWPVPADQRPEAIIAMAGGYSTFTRPGGALTYFNDHFVSIDLARRYQIPAIMFPVSIGPIYRPTRARLFAAYRAFHTVMVRDDESLAELTGLPNVLRVPDMAAQAIARRHAAGVDLTRAVDGPIALIGRRLEDEPASYAERCRELGRRTNGVWHLQVSKDEKFYRDEQLSYEPGALDYNDLRASAPVVVSVRLHGALMSILNGIPAIHLSYDRKGAGAYRDLGIDEWLHDSADFDPAVVADQATTLAADPAPFWQRISERLPVLEKMMAEQDARIADFWTQVLRRRAA